MITLRFWCAINVASLFSVTHLDFPRSFHAAGREARGQKGHRNCILIHQKMISILSGLKQSLR